MRTKRFRRKVSKIGLVLGVVGYVGIVSVGMGHGPGGHVHGHGEGRMGLRWEDFAEQPLGEVFWELHGEGKRGWGASVATMFESRHVHFGVTEADRSPVFGTEMTGRWNRLTAGAGYFFATNNRWSKWNFAVTWDLRWGPVVVRPGYNFRYIPELLEEGQGDEHAGHEHAEHVDEHAHELAHGHGHKKYGHELFVVGSLEAFRYVTPSVLFLWDLYDEGGGVLEMRLDGEVPLVKGQLSLQPYAVLGVTFEYGGVEYSGANHFQYGGKLVYRPVEWVAMEAGVAHNVPLRGSQLSGSISEAIATVGIRVSY